MNKNGTLWYDTDGNSIQAHGGMILFHEGRYYWYGENKNGATSIAPSGDIRVDFIGISCYSSTDCLHWKNEGIVLPASDEPDHDLYKTGYVNAQKYSIIKKQKNLSCGCILTLLTIRQPGQELRFPSHRPDLLNISTVIFRTAPTAVT